MSLDGSPFGESSVASRWPLPMAGPRASAVGQPLPIEATPVWAAAYFAAHVLLSLVAQRVVVVSTVWALATLLVGFVALSRPRTSERLVVVVAYIVGAELVWRGTHAAVFWEYGKYTLILLLGTAVLANSAKYTSILSSRGLASAVRS